MPEYQQKKPSFDRERDDGMYDAANDQAAFAAQATRKRAADISEQSVKTLGNINDVLTSNDKSDVSTSPQEATGSDAIDANEDQTNENSDIPAEEASLFNEDDDTGDTFKNRLKGRLGSKRLWLGGGVFGGIIVIVLIFVLLLFSSLKLPNLAENIIKFQFARVTREYAKSSEKLTDESLSKKAITKLRNTKTGAQLEKTVNDLHDKATGLKDGAIGKVKGIPGVTNVLALNNKFNPAQVERNLNRYGLTYGATSDGRPTITISGQAAEGLIKNANNSGKVSLIHPERGVTLTAEAPRGVKLFIPFYSTFFQANEFYKLTQTDQFTQTITNAYAEGEGLRSTGNLVRGAALNRILQREGISRIAFRIIKFKNKNKASEQGVVIDTEARAATAPQDGHVSSGVGDINGASQDAVNQENAAVAAAESDTSGKTNDSLRSQSGGTGIDRGAVKKIAAGLSDSVLKNRVTGILAGGGYQALFLACVFDDAADANSGSKSIDAANDSNQRTFAQFAGVADEQKRGPTSNQDVAAFDNMLAAANNKAGDDTTNSIPYQRASSGQQPDTSGELAAQSGPFGYQTLKNTLNNNLFYNIAMFAKPSCSAITNPAGLGADIAATLATSFYKKGLDEGATLATHSVLGIIQKGFTHEFSKTFGHAALESGGKSLIVKNVITKPLKLYGGFWVNSKIVAGVEFLGALSGASRSPGVTHNGHETGNNWINEADAGGNATANEQDREMLMGRPLVRDEVCNSQADDATFLSARFKAQSSFQRYLATSNSQSLLSRGVMTAGSELSGPVSRPLVKLSSLVTKPGNLIGSVLRVFSHKAFALQSTNCDSSSADYGNVQFGWSRGEEALIDSNVSYKPDENLAILAESGKAKDIAATYAKCFGYKLDDNNNLVYDETATIGSLLSGDNPAIQRDAQGNVLPDVGDCSPNNLSFNNSSAGKDSDPSSPQTNDLVFRWRLAVRYQHAQDQMSALQNAGTASK